MGTIKEENPTVEVGTIKEENPTVEVGTISQLYFLQVRLIFIQKV